ncbi:MAG: hypothetical protein ACOYYU_10365 [Chloroflexota bacterium]
MSANPKIILPLMTAAAASVVGQTVMVRLRSPITENCVGQAYRDSQGVLSIDLAQRLLNDPDELLRVFLHECGHLYLQPIPEDERRNAEVERLFTELGPLIRLEESELRQCSDTPQELEAESFAVQIGRILAYKAESSGDAGIENRLRILSNMQIYLSEEKSHD